MSDGYRRVVRSLRRASECGDTDDGLVERAVRNATPTKHRPRWASVMRVFGVGSTSAQNLCRRFNLDPDETL